MMFQAHQKLFDGVKEVNSWSYCHKNLKASLRKAVVDHKENRDADAAKDCPC